MERSTVKSSGQPASDGAEDIGSPSARVARIIESRFQEAVARAIGDHHLHGNPVAIWRDGQIVMLHPDGSVQPVNGQEPAPQEPADES